MSLLSAYSLSQRSPSFSSASHSSVGCYADPKGLPSQNPLVSDERIHQPAHLCPHSKVAYLNLMRETGSEANQPRPPVVSDKCSSCSQHDRNKVFLRETYALSLEPISLSFACRNDMRYDTHPLGSDIYLSRMVILRCGMMVCCQTGRLDINFPTSRTLTRLFRQITRLNYMRHAVTNLLQSFIMMFRLRYECIAY